MKLSYQEELAHILLIELLSYQFASPVKWIETQNVLLDDYKIEALIEIGPQPILANMMKKTFLEKQEQLFSRGNKDVKCVCVSDIQEINYYQPSKIIQQQASSEKSHDKKNKNIIKSKTFNPFSNNNKIVNNKADKNQSFVEFVNAETSKTKTKTSRLNANNFERQTLVLETLSAQKIPKNDLIKEYVNLSNENKFLSEALDYHKNKTDLLFFEEVKIRVYDNSYNWIKEDIFQIALASNFDKINSDIKNKIYNFLTDQSIPVTFVEQLDNILKYYNKSVDLLMQHFIANEKEAASNYCEPRSDSNETLFEIEDNFNGETTIFELTQNSLTISTQDYTSNTFVNGKNQCCLLMFDEVNNVILDYCKELLSQNTNIICCFNCKNSNSIYSTSALFQNLYKKNASFFSSLRLIPANLKTDPFGLIDYIYKKLNFDVSFAFNYCSIIDINLLSSAISQQKSKLSFLTPPTTIISEFSNLTHMLKVAKQNQNFICHIHYESFDGNLKELIKLANVKKNLKVTLNSNNNDIFKICSLENIFRNDNIFYIYPLAEIKLPKPTYSSYEQISKKYNGELLQNNLSPENVVVVTGFSEIGPLGNASTRWDYEKNYCKFAIESIVYLSLIMGLIDYDSNSSNFIDSKTKKLLSIDDIKKYENHILNHTGIRVLENDIADYDPNKKKMLQEIILLKDFKTTVPEETMIQYKLEHGNDVEITPIKSDFKSEQMYEIHFKTGSKLFLPKALKFDRFVAGQIPSGWNASFYGISKEIINQVDRVTLFALITTAEALITSGIVDPYELYSYMHVSEVGNCSGSGLGGLKSHQKMQKKRFLDTSVQNDILQETFINVMSAWVNMLLLSSSGPIKTPVGACSTALESLELGYETIMAGKAKMVLIGGYDDLIEETSYEFSAMGATSNAQKETRAGRSPKEMCRPMTDTRDGFMESHGSGIQVLMRGDLAIKMGLPVFGVVGFTSMHSDKISKSLPAPGKGIISTSRKNTNKKRRSKKMELEYRKKQVQKLDHHDFHTRKYWNVDFYKNDANISPLEGALAVFGLTIDDITVGSFHGTSTKANDKNESLIINTIMKNCNRSIGNILPVVVQKSITGHPKAAAGAWMINGALQMFKDCLIPGNFNADNIDIKLTSSNEFLLYNKDNICNMERIKAVIVTSFGFGQKGSLAVLLNPNYILATLNNKDLNEYIKKFEYRYKKSNSKYQYRMHHNSLFVEKTEKPFKNIPDENIYLDTKARTKYIYS
ncbi:hypothetical protein QEN19_004254 [Hanseniaspora menglaensis]